MAAKDFLQNPQMGQLIEDLKRSGSKFDKAFDPDLTDQMDRLIDRFKTVTGSNEDFLLDTLKKERDDLYKYLHHVMGDDGKRPFALEAVLMFLIAFVVTRHFSGKLTDYLLNSPKVARQYTKQYNEAFGIVPEKPKKAPKPKAEKGEKRIVAAPPVETGLKYSEFDEDYYFMAIEHGREGNVIINPNVQPIGEREGSLVYVPFAPIYGDHKDFRYLDFLSGSMGSLFVSERIRMQLTDLIPDLIPEMIPKKKGIGFGRKCYLKAGEEFLPYYFLFFPRYKFIDKDHLKLIDGSKGIIYHGDSTDGLGDIVYHSFKAGMMKKMPVEERLLFQVDFHSLGWHFCLKEIRDKIEATGATGIKLTRSMDMNWYEYNASARRALEEYVSGE